jgi:hypothetical protein
LFVLLLGVVVVAIDGVAAVEDAEKGGRLSLLRPQGEAKASETDQRLQNGSANGFGGRRT